MRKKWMFLAPVLFLLFIALGGEIVRLLWNWLLPSIFGWRAITFWQALGLLALCRILFGGFRLHSGDRSGARRRILEQMEQMTPEERDRLRQGFRERCGFRPPAGEGQ